MSTSAGSKQGAPSVANPSRTFVRVRPFTAEEGSICPADSPAPREVLAWNGRDSLTVLDAQDGFVPRKNGTFATGQVLWSFEDDEVPDVKPVHQSEVYKTTVAPQIASIVEGYNAAFLIAGAASSGRLYTLYGGKDVDGHDRGVLPRFAEDILNAFEAQRQENSFITAEMEVIEINGESYVDMLAVKRPGAPSELKLAPGPEGPRLAGATSIEIRQASDFHAAFRQIHRTIAKRNTTHTVSIRFTETFEFDGPENINQPVKQSRRVHVLFALLRNMPPSFMRCVEVAAEHDSGENPMAKVPIRETAFTKLYPMVLQQGYNLVFISCVSPFFEHVKDTMNTLAFAVKVKKLKGKPKLTLDESLQEMRRLTDEVKDLKTTVRKQNEAMSVIQKELNAREVALMKQEDSYKRMSEGMMRAKNDLRIAEIGRKYQLAKSRRAHKQMDADLEKRRKAMADLKNASDSKCGATLKAMRAADDATSAADGMDKKITEREQMRDRYKKMLDEHVENEKELKDLERFNNASPEEQQELYKVQRSNMSGEELEKQKKERDGLKTKSDASAKQVADIENSAAYKQVEEEEKPRRQREALEKEVAAMEKRIADEEEKNKRLQNEAAQKKAACCSVM